MRQLLVNWSAYLGGGKAGEEDCIVLQDAMTLSIQLMIMVFDYGA